MKEERISDWILDTENPILERFSPPNKGHQIKLRFQIKKLKECLSYMEGKPMDLNNLKDCLDLTHWEFIVLALDAVPKLISCVESLKTRNALLEKEKESLQMQVTTLKNAIKIISL